MTGDLVVGGQLGNYLIESVIGRGGMSVVYRARHTRLGTSAALKVLAPELSSDDTFRERFLREAQMAAGIEHPNVIPIHDMGMRDESLYIVMRYITGGDLKALLAASGPLEAGHAAALLAPVARALDAAHARGLVHRDVKPGNILIQRGGGGEIEQVYLTDFGIAKSSHISGLTQTGALIGTVDYMAPEQIEGGKVSAQTDVYALGAVLYECITGHRPFERAPREGAWPPLGELQPVCSLRPELPAALDGVIAKALSRAASERYATCEQFVHAFTYVLETRTSDVGGLAGDTVADATPLPVSDTVDAVPEPAPTPATQRDAVRTGDADSRPPQPPPSPAKPKRRAPRARLTVRPWHGALAIALLVGAIVAALVLTSSSSSPAGPLSFSALAQVPTNHVTGSGNVTVHLKGNVAAITLTTRGLDENAPLVHALHFHANGKGECPPATAARLHGGHRTISTTDGINYYGPPVQSLTTSGDVSTGSILAFARYPTGGTISYSRTLRLPASVAANLRRNNAVVVVHGIDYDHKGVYTGVLERSELNRSVPATATAPALCGVLVEQRSAALRPDSGRQGLVYSASLHNTAAPALPSSALFACEAAAGPAPTRASRRRAGRGATVQSTARA
jgi:serine/threonine protein kinase